MKLPLIVAAIVFTALIQTANSSCQVDRFPPSEVGEVSDATSRSRVADFQQADSRIVPDADIDWDVSETKSGSSGNLKRIQFVDASVGFLISAGGSLFQTSDGGNSWRKLTSPETDFLVDMYFLSPLDGFLISLKRDPEKLRFPHGNFSRPAGFALHRTSDGGNTWSESFELEGVFPIGLEFDSGGIGVIIGHRTLGADTQHVVLISSNRGEKWTDVSSAVNENSPKSNEGMVLDSPAKAILGSDRNVTVLTDSGRIYESGDFGRTWNVGRVGFKKEGLQIPIVGGFGRLENGGFWRAGYVLGTEGKRSTVSVVDDRRKTEVRLSNYSLQDVRMLANGSMLAAGSNVSVKNNGVNPELNTGVVLSSADFGKSWKVVYESKQTYEYSGIALISDERVVVGGANGAILLLTARKTQ